MAEKEGKITWKLVLAVVSVVVIVIFFAFYFGIIKKTCKDDACFDDALKDCSMSTYLKLYNMNYYKYTIDGKKSGDCVISIKLVKMALGTPQEKIDMFEGKSMKCSVPVDEASKMTSENMESMLSYCTGSLKEAMYEQIITKLYTLIVANMGEILGEIEDVLSGRI